MTQNQIAYWQLQETKQHNRKDESIREAANVETGRHDLATELETSRANKANELLKQQSNNISAGQLAETKRANLERERQARDTLAETKRNNLDVNRISQQKNAIEQQKANVQSANLDVQKAQLMEQSRHNKQTEAIQGYTAVANNATQLLSTGIKVIGGIMR